MKALPIVPNEHSEVCRACEGQCCKTQPGAFHPEQFSNEDELLQGLRSGAWVLVVWEGDPRPRRTCFDVDCDGSCAACLADDRLPWVLYPQPRTDRHGPGLVQRERSGRCTLLGPSGCTLPFTQRPAGCQSLEVNLDAPGHCRSYAQGRYNTTLDVAASWVPYQAVFHRLVSDARAGRHAQG